MGRGGSSLNDYERRPHAERHYWSIKYDDDDDDSLSEFSLVSEKCKKVTEMRKK